MERVITKKLMMLMRSALGISGSKSPLPTTTLLIIKVTLIIKSTDDNGNYSKHKYPILKHTKKDIVI